MLNIHSNEYRGVSKLKILMKLPWLLIKTSLFRYFFFYFVLHSLSICEWIECRCSVGRIKNSILLRVWEKFVGSNLCKAFIFLLAELPTNIMSTERIAETYSGNNREKCHILQTTTRLSTKHRDFIGVFG